MRKGPPRVKPSRDVRRQSRRDAILKVAAQAFLDRGYAGTTMSRIAATLGGSKGTLWNHFPSKDRLFAAVLQVILTGYRTRIAEILAPSDDVEKTLRQFCQNLLQKVTSPEAIALHRLVVAEAGRISEVGQIFHDLAMKPTLEAMADYLSRAMAVGLIRDSDPLSAARLLATLCLSGCHLDLLMGQIPRVSAARLDSDVERSLAEFLGCYAPLGR